MNSKYDKKEIQHHLTTDNQTISKNGGTGVPACDSEDFHRHGPLCHYQEILKPTFFETLKTSFESQPKKPIFTVPWDGCELK